MQTLIQDVRYALRMAVKNPGFTAVGVISLAIGIGANAGIFSLVDKLLLRSLPVKAPEQLVLLSAESVSPRFLNTIFSYPDFADYRDQNEVFSGLIAFNQIEAKLGRGDDSERVRVEMVSGNYFDVLGVRPAHGRTFLSEEDRTESTHPVVVVSHGLWRRSFGSDPKLVGRAITLGETDYTVVGIMPEGFTGVQLESPSDAWAPLMMRPQLMPGAVTLRERKLAWLRLMGRLKTGVTAAQAQKSLDLLARNIRELHAPPGDRNLPFFERRMLVEPGGKGISFLRKQLDRTLRFLMAVVVLLLLIACANVATLLLAKSTARRKEIALRLALGASRSRLVRQLLTESILLSLAGAGAGLLLAPWLHDLLLAFQPNFNLPETALQGPDARVLGFTLLVSLLSGAVFGLVPALQSSSVDLVPALKDLHMRLEARDRRWSARSLLVVAQVALALVVLAGAGLFIRSLRNLFAIDPGFRTENVLLVPVELPRERYAHGFGRESSPGATARRNQFFRQLTEQLENLPGVEAVTTASITPLSGSRGTMSVQIEGYQTKANEHIGIDYNEVGPGYHELMGISIVQGRGFTEQDREGAQRVVVINEALAGLYFPNQSPIGKRLRGGRGGSWLEIVGVARDIKIHSLTETPIPHIDLPNLQHSYGNFARVLIRTTGRAASILPAVRQAVKELDPGASITGARTLSEELSNSIAPARMATSLTSLFALTALLLASIGLYGVMAYHVTRRTREIGIRMALGAQRPAVLALVLGEGIALVAIGLALGLAGAFAATRLVAAQLYDVSASDPVTFALISLLLTTVALLACWIPARRASKVDPMVALRYE